MAQQIFAYILYKDGVADDTALELIAAAREIDPDASGIAVVIGTGADLDAVCQEVASSYTEVWKIDNEALAYPNAEVIRDLLIRILPTDGIVLVPHEHFGMDLAPGLSIKLDASFIPDAVEIEGIEDGKLKESYPFNTGAGGDVVIVRTFYEWDLVAKIPGVGLGNMPNNNRLLIATTTFRNEPFDN